jgi:1-acyl-sn-glycerol-3-phosphate acyltransferase
MEIKDLKTGAVRIAARTGAPLIPLVLWGTQRLMTKDHPRDFSRGTAISIRVGAPLPITGTDPIGETAALKAALQALLDDAITSYPQQTDGAWWVPASYGGTAPTLAEAKELDAAERRQRAEARRAAKK